MASLSPRHSSKKSWFCLGHWLTCLPGQTYETLFTVINIRSMDKNFARQVFVKPYLTWYLLQWHLTTRNPSLYLWEIWVLHSGFLSIRDFWSTRLCTWVSFSRHCTFILRSWGSIQTVQGIQWFQLQEFRVKPSFRRNLLPSHTKIWIWIQQHSVPLASSLLIRNFREWLLCQLTFQCFCQ